MSAQSLLARAGRIGARELVWRGRSAARRMADRARLAYTGSEWNRGRLAALLISRPGLSGVQAAAVARRWDDAHAGLVRYFVSAPQRFVVAPAIRRSLTARIRRDFPSAAEEAANRGDRILTGEYDLLGYRGLRFDDTAGG